MTPTEVCSLIQRTLERLPSKSVPRNRAFSKYFLFKSGDPDLAIRYEEILRLRTCHPDGFFWLLFLRNHPDNFFVIPSAAANEVISGSPKAIRIGKKHKGRYYPTCWKLKHKNTPHAEIYFLQNQLTKSTIDLKPFHNDAISFEKNIFSHWEALDEPDSWQPPLTKCPKCGAIVKDFRPLDSQCKNYKCSLRWIEDQNDWFDFDEKTNSWSKLFVVHSPQTISR